MPTANAQLNYTTINHTARVKLGLTWLEYGLADSIFRLSNNPSSKFPGWCYAKKESLAHDLGISKQSIHNLLNKLEKKGLIERKPNTSHVKTTASWYNEIEIVKKVYSNGKESLLSSGTENGKESLHNNSIIKRSNRGVENSPSFLQEIPEKDIGELTQKYKCSDSQLKSKAEDLYNYCLAKGKRYSNYKAFLRNALKKDFGIRPPKIVSIDELEISEEQRLKNLAKWEAMKANMPIRNI